METTCLNRNSQGNKESNKAARKERGQNNNNTETIRKVMEGNKNMEIVNTSGNLG